MNEEERSHIKSLTSQQEMMVVAHAEDAELANDYVQLLDDNGIISRVSPRDAQDGFGVAIEVPEDFYDEAHMIIDSQQSDNGFYDFFYEDPDSIDCDSELDYDDYDNDDDYF